MCRLDDAFYVRVSGIVHRLLEVITAVLRRYLFSHATIQVIDPGGYGESSLKPRGTISTGGYARYSKLLFFLKKDRTMMYEEMAKLPVILTEYIQAPDVLDTNAEVIWDLTIKNLVDRKILQSGDLIMIRNYSAACSALMDVERRLSKADLVTEDGKVNPLGGYAIKLQANIKSMATCLKITPAARTNDRLKHTPQVENASPEREKWLELIK